MLSKWLFISLLALGIQNISTGNYIRNNIPIFNNNDISKFNIFYNPNTQSPIKGALEDFRDPFSGIRHFRGAECSCDGDSHTCSCCIDINITRPLNFDRHACVNLIFIEDEFAINLKLIINEKEIINASVSGKNPEPVCIPVYPPFLSFCVRAYDIYTKGKNLHTCIDLETRVIAWPILILHFDCIKIGTDGFFWTKPENNSLPLMAELAMITQEVNGPEIYDQVNFEPESPEFLNNHTSNLTPEEENNIGQLKL